MAAGTARGEAGGGLQALQGLHALYEELQLEAVQAPHLPRLAALLLRLAEAQRQHGYADRYRRDLTWAAAAPPAAGARPRERPARLPQRT